MTILDPNPANRRTEVRRIIRRWAAIAGVSVAELARRTGRSQQALDKLLTESGGAVPLADLGILAAALGPGFLDELLADVHLRAVTTSEPEAGQSLLGAHVEAMREVAEAQITFAEAVADGAVTPCEMARIERESGEAVRAVEGQIAAARAAVRSRA
jgi:hypothetical protein